MTEREPAPWRALAALLLGPLLLVACIPAEPADSPAPEPAQPVASLDTVRIEPAAHPPSVPSVASPIRDGREADGPPVEPEFLIGLDRVALQRAVGAPTLRRREARAEVWQYQADACVMDAFLYATPDGKGVPRVTYVELRRNGVAILTDPAERRACYAEAVAAGKRNAALGGAEP